MKTKNIFILVITIIIIFSYNLLALNQSSFPAMVIIYDDGYIEDIEKALPVHQKYNVPAVSAVYSSIIGKNGFLDQKDLLELEKNGWEIASHGKYHTALIYFSLLEKINKGDMTVKINNSYLIEFKHDYYIFNFDKNYGEVISFKKYVQNKNKSYFILENRVKNSYQKNNTNIMLTENSLKEEIVKSKEELQKLGLTVNSFVYPYNGYTNLAKDIVKHNYNFARGGREIGEKFPECFINYIPLSKYRLKGVSFETNHIRKDQLDILISETAKNNGVLIFYAHTANINFNTDRLEYIIKSAKKLNFKFITLNELINSL
ncbi:MAG: polysaccharide deacetylase family protein [Halanaerobiales bacterium]|nr:polysaccharide deacetylase family protein [Halanaerobiales bacterium]